MTHPSSLIERTSVGFLNNDLLTRIHERAGAHDLADESLVDDLEDLREAGYLSAFTPEEYEGARPSLEETAAEQTRLAKAAPSITLSINIHQIIVGLRRHLLRNGNPRDEIILHDVVADELYGFGTSEPGNDLVLFDSITEALLDSEGGYSFEGVKILASLASMWTCLVTSGRDDSEEDGPRSVFAILKREDGGFSIEDDRNTLDIRATQSNMMILEGAYTPEDHTLTRCEPSPLKDPVAFGIFSHFEVLLAAIYVGIRGRTVEVAAEHVKARRLVKGQSVYANDSDIRWGIAEVVIIMNAVSPQIRELARDIGGGIDRGPIWMPQLSAVKNVTAEASLRAVEQSVRVCDEGAYYNGHELSRLYRDVLAGLFQPNDQESLCGTWARAVLGSVAE